MNGTHIKPISYFVETEKRRNELLKYHVSFPLRFVPLRYICAPVNQFDMNSLPSVSLPFRMRVSISFPCQLSVSLNVP